MIPSKSKHSPVIGPGVAFNMVNHPHDEQVVEVLQPRAQLPLCGAEAFATNPSDVACDGAEPRKHTQYPYVTGASVLAMTYQGGVLMACDTLAAYGSTKRYKSVERIYKVNDSCVVGASGEISDFQYIQKLLAEIAMDDFIQDDGITLSPKQIHAYLTRVMYNRRNKFDPLWNTLVVGGIQDGEPFCAMVTMIGVHFEDVHVCTGFAAQLGLPLIREAHSPTMSEAEATALMHKALKVCYYRDKDSINKFIMAKVTSAGVTISEPFAVQTEWNFNLMRNPTAFSVGAW